MQCMCKWSQKYENGYFEINVIKLNSGNVHRISYPIVILYAKDENRYLFC